MVFPTRSNTMADMHRWYCAALTAGALVAIFGAPVRAADESDWSQDARSAIRLIAGANEKGQTPLRAGIEIKLQPQWKTYWRYPGDSGVPPRFDFSGSENVKSVNVLYPAPHLFTDEAGQALG